MKRLLVMLGVSGLLGGTVFAGPSEGTWTTPGGLGSTASWSETFIGGGPGQAGNVLSGSGLHWLLDGATLSSVVPNTDPLYPQYTYQTTYVGGTLMLASGGPWGSGVDYPYFASLDPITVWSTGTTPANPVNPLAWKMEGSGRITGTMTAVSIGATFDSTQSDYHWLTNNTGMSGSITTAEITTSPVVPAPAGILLAAIGTGIVGHLRRRRML